MNHNNCPICLDSLCSSSASPIGVATPCGHCFHRSCFQTWAVTSTHQSLRVTDGTEMRPKCPTCNTLVTKFVDIYLNFDTISLTSSVDEDSPPVDVINVDNGVVSVVDRNSRNQQNNSKQLVKKYLQEMTSLRTQVHSIKNELENTEIQVATQEKKEKLITSELEAMISDNCRYKRSMLELQSKVTEADIKREKTTQQLVQLKKGYDHELQRAKANSMVEVQEIMERNANNSRKNDSLVKHVRVQEMEIEKLKKDNAYMIKLTRQDNNTKLEAVEIKSIIPKSQSSKAKQYACARRQVELEQEAESKEAITVRKRSQARAMMKQSSAQASRVFKAARISTNNQKSAITKVPFSSTVTSNSSHHKNMHCVGNIATSEKLILNFHVDSHSASSTNINKNSSINAILSQKTSTRRFIRGKPKRRKDEPSSYSIKNFFS